MSKEILTYQQALVSEHSIVNDIVMYNNETYTHFDSGLTRHVFVNKDKTKVIKFLVDSKGFSTNHNKEEFDIYENSSDEVKKELAHTTYDGYVIEQEFCEPVKLSDKKMTIPQILFAESCRNEVGWNSKGELVCFDLDEHRKW